MKFLLRAGFAAALFVLALPAMAATTIVMQCAPYQVMSGGPYPSSGPYTADLDGIVTGVNINDVNALEADGCNGPLGVSGYTLIGRIVGANMNATTDQAATMFINSAVGWIPALMVVKDCSTSLTTAQGAAYDAASKGGNRIFGSGTTQAYTACTGSGTAVTLAAATQAVVETGSTAPKLSLTTAQGAAATANVYFYGYVLGQ